MYPDGYCFKKNQFAIPKTNLLYNFKSNLLWSLLSFRSADVAGEQEQLVTLHYKPSACKFQRISGHLWHNISLTFCNIWTQQRYLHFQNKQQLSSQLPSWIAATFNKYHQQYLGMQSSDRLICRGLDYSNHLCVKFTSLYFFTHFLVQLSVQYCACCLMWWLSRCKILF